MNEFKQHNLKCHSEQICKTKESTHTSPTSAFELELDTERVLSWSMFRKEETFEYKKELSREMILQIELWRIAENTTCKKQVF